MQIIICFFSDLLKVSWKEYSVLIVSFPIFSNFTKMESKKWCFLEIHYEFICTSKNFCYWIVNLKVSIYIHAQALLYLISIIILNNYHQSFPSFIVLSELKNLFTSKYNMEEI